MGKNTTKPVHKSQMHHGGGGGDFDEEAKPFHSKEYEEAQLQALLAGSQRPSWDEFKEQQRKKGELEGAEERLELEAQIRFRKELDEARNERFSAADAAAAGSKKKKHKHKHKDKKSGTKEKKKKRTRDAEQSESDSSDSDSDEEARGKKKKKKHKSDKKSSKHAKADGPVSLKAFFAEGSSDED